MNTIDIVLGASTIFSLLFAIMSFAQSYLKGKKEQANIEIMKEKMNSLTLGLLSILHISDGIVQTSKQQEANIEDIRNMARIMRGQVTVLLNGAGKHQRELQKWKFGKVMKSDPFSHNDNV